MKKLETYLFFNGNCAEAMRFYERVFGGKLSLLPAKDAPDPSVFPPGSGDKIMHSKLELADGAVIMASDWLASGAYPGMGGFSETRHGNAGLRGHGDGFPRQPGQARASTAPPGHRPDIPARARRRCTRRHGGARHDRQDAADRTLTFQL